MTTHSPTVSWLSIASAFAFLLCPFSPAEDNDRYARIILFADEAGEIPENYPERLGSLAHRTEKFFKDGLEQWDRPAERSDIFARDTDGNIEITVVKGKLLNANGRAALPEIQRKAVQSASQQLSLEPGDKVIWWIFYHYEGVKGFQGGARGSGGLAINAYPDGEGAIELEWELASPPMVEQAIKGTIHEFGHALGLPHIGPRPTLDLGNSLMGPINKSYWERTNTDDERVYLNEASAALIEHHPIFKSGITAEPMMPEGLNANDFTATHSDDGKAILIKGNVKASPLPGTVVAVDSARHQFGDYWARSYVGKVDSETGVFEVSISEPFESGTVYLSFCFDNGINSGDGEKMFQRGSDLSFRYPESLN